MKFNTDGLVIREVNVKEQDKVVTILTRSNGIIRAYVKDAKNIKKSKSTATGLLIYSQFVIYKNRDRYMIDEGFAQESFMQLRKDVEKLALAQYFCELLAELAPEEDPAESFLRLTLNALYFLCKADRSPSIIKSAFELRLLSLSGYMPNLIYCDGCGCYEHEDMCFVPESGNLLCGDCIGTCKADHIHTGIAVTHALRHCVLCEPKKLFAFNLSAECCSTLERAIELYIKAHINRRFKTLDFYKQMRDMNINI